MPRSKPSSPIATRQPSPGCADDEVGVGAGVGEERLVELAAAGDLDDRADLDAGLVHRHEQEAAGPGGAREPGSVRATTKHQWLHVGERRPHLLPVDHPLVAVEHARGS